MEPIINRDRMITFVLETPVFENSSRPRSWKS
jgi:hypothetical protein